MSQDISIREHKHIQTTKASFHHECFAPAKGTDVARFAVEPSVYITGVGFEQVDPMARRNEFMIGSRDYVRMIELIYGYKHLGNSSEQMSQVMENLWGEKV